MVMASPIKALFLDFFISSGFVHFRKPDADISRSSGIFRSSGPIAKGEDDSGALRGGSRQL